MPRAKNPFRPGVGLKPPYLAGRKEEIESFVQMLQDIESGIPQNMIIWGLRGVGKTVLLVRLNQTCLDNGFLPITNLAFDFTYSNPKTFLQFLKNTLDTEIAKLSSRDKLKKQVKKLGKYAMPKEIEVAGIVSYQPAYDSDEALLPDQMIVYLKKAYKQLTNSGSKGIVFLFDEFHTVENIKENEWNALGSFLAAISTLQMEGYKYSLVLSGLPTMLRHIKEAKSNSERMFLASLKIANLDDDAAKKAILEPLKKTEWKFSDDLVSRILSDSDGYPYFLQFLAKEIIDRANKSSIDMNDYANIRSAMMKKLGLVFFEQRVESLSAGQLDVLYVMSSVQKEEVEFTSIASKMNINKGTIYNHLKHLEEKGTIYRSRRGAYRFSIPLFSNYLRNRYHSGRA